MLNAYAGELLIVVIGGQRRAVPMERIAEVRIHYGATRIPGAPPWIHGFVERSGAPVEVFDAAQRLGIGALHLTPRSCLLFFESAAMLVEGVDRIVAADSCEEPVLDLEEFFGSAVPAVMAGGWS